MLRLGIALALLALAGCGGDDDGDGGDAVVVGVTPAPAQRACTEIGCAPEGVVVDFSRMPGGNVAVVFCVERKCVKDASRGAPMQGVGQFLPKGRKRVRVAVIVRRNGRVIARDSKRMRVRISRPNGPDCPPPCRYVRARFDVATSRLEQT